MYILHTFQKLNVVTVYFLPGNHLYAQSASWTSHIDNLEDEYSLLSISANTVARVGVACAWLIGQSTVAVGRRWDVGSEHLLVLARCRALTNHNFSELVENIGDALRQLRMTRFISAIHCACIDSANMRATANCAKALCLIPLNAWT